MKQNSTPELLYFEVENKIIHKVENGIIHWKCSHGSKKQVTSKKNQQKKLSRFCHIKNTREESSKLIIHSKKKVLPLYFLT